MTGRVLAMDDEPAIRQLLIQILAHFGCRCTAVADGAEALREYGRAREAGESYHCVITDLTVPGAMGGAELITHLRKMDPGVRAIVSSGYSNDPVLANFREHGFVARIDKPYRLNEVAVVLKEVLEGKAALPV
jgi:CheY-like chemotaxis protein